MMLSITRDTRGGKPVITMPPLLLDAHEPGCRHAAQMTTCRLRRDTGNTRELRCRERTPIHQGVQHPSSCRIACKCSYLREDRVARHVPYLASAQAI